MSDAATGAGEARLDTPLHMFLRSRIRTAMEGLTLLLFFGSAGYFVLGRLHYAGLLTPKLDQPWAVLDCVYMTVITVSTIGYGEVLPISDLPPVKLYTIGLIMVGMILVAFSVSSATAFFVDGDLQHLLLRRRAMKKIARLRDHFIVCGFGVTGRVILEELLETGHAVVVIDGDAARAREYADHPQVIPLVGDATTDAVLHEAGIERAAGLAAALPSDKDNLFLIISVRQLRRDIRIVSSASDLTVRDKLIRAGADGVVSSSFIGGLRLASELVRPAVVSFLDLMLRKSDSPVRFAQVVVGEGWAGRTLGQLDVPGTTGLPVLAAAPPATKEFVFNPPGDYLLEAGTVLVTRGEVARVRELARRIGARRSGGGAEFLGGEEPQVPVVEDRLASGERAGEPDAEAEPDPPL